MYNFKNIRRGALIIEDSFNDYQMIKEVLLSDGWKIYPNIDSEEEYKELFFRTNESDNDIEKIIYKIITYLESEETYSNIGVVILDIQLIKDSDAFEGKEIIKMFRSPKYRIQKDIIINDDYIEYWLNKVPVIALTSFDSLEESLSTEMFNVEAFLSKEDFEDDKKTLIYQSTSLYRYFKMWLQQDDPRVTFLELKNTLDLLKNNEEIILLNIDNIKIILEKKFNDVDNKLSAILEASIKGINDEREKESFVNEYLKGLKDEIPQEDYNKLKESIEKPSFKEKFKQTMKEGGFVGLIELISNDVLGESFDKNILGGKIMRKSVELLLKNASNFFMQKSQ
jgi:hypothetical protein